MLQKISQLFTNRPMLQQIENERAAIEAWSLHFGREAAELWVQALSVRDAARLSNA